MAEVKAQRELCSSADGSTDLAALAAALRAAGFDCRTRSISSAPPAAGTRGSPVERGCLEKLRHSYIVCEGRLGGGCSQVGCLVDPRFREQFHIAQSTPAFDALLKVRQGRRLAGCVVCVGMFRSTWKPDKEGATASACAAHAARPTHARPCPSRQAVPIEFVGSQLRLRALVELLSVEMAEAFRSQCLPLPPWRRTEAMLSKWMGRPEGEALAAEAEVAPSPFASPARAGSAPLPMQQQGAAAAAASTGGGAWQLLPLQAMAAAAIAERSGGGGGSQDFYEALSMHTESMRLAEEAGVAAAGRSGSGSPLLALQQRQQQGVTGAGASGMGAADPEALVPHSSSSEVSNKPRRRRQGLAGGSPPLPSPGLPCQPHVPPAAWQGNPGKGGDSPGSDAPVQLVANGSWESQAGLSTILETRSLGSSSSLSSQAPERPSALGLRPLAAAAPGAFLATQGSSGARSSGSSLVLGSGGGGVGEGGGGSGSGSGSAWQPREKGKVVSALARSLKSVGVGWQALLPGIRTVRRVRGGGGGTHGPPLVPLPRESA